MYQSPDMTLWRGRFNPNKNDKLWHQVVTPLDMTNDLWRPTTDHNAAIIGFASDEGVRRNFGRVGAIQGPEYIRKMCTGLAVHFDTDKKGIVDAGNVICNGNNLEGAFSQMTEKVLHLLNEGFFPIVLGGGHETSYPHFKALQQFVGNDKTIGIINFDAHFDLRTYESGPHSGSSFLNIYDDSVKEGFEFHYLPVGIRQESNIPSLFKVMRETGQGYILLDEVQYEWGDVREKVAAFIEEKDHIYITIDLDCFPSAYAPGVSAAAPDGMLPREVQSLMKLCFGSKKVLSLDIVEINPQYDDGRTAKLAATLVYDVVTTCF